MRILALRPLSFSDAACTFSSLTVALPSLTPLFVPPLSSVHLVLALMDSPATRDVYGWPHAFELEYAVKLTGRSLQTSLTVTNPRLVEWAQGFQVRT